MTASSIEASAAPAAAASAPPAETAPAASAACVNCGAELAGPWCHACGQSTEDYHRSILRLAGEAFENAFDLDSRLWRTLPTLCLRPAQLTRRFLDGHRVGQIPPLRMFLVVVVLVFLVAGLGAHDRTQLQINGAGAKLTTNGVNVTLMPKGDYRAVAWVTAHLKTAASRPELFETSLVEWAQRLVVLALPLSAALLGLTFFWRRGVYLFDHLIFSMHSLSFQGVLLATTMLLGRLSDWFGWLLLIAPIHLFAHLKATYGLGVFGTLARMAVLFVGSVIGFLIALTALLLIGLAEVGQ